jgi:hypothetical protein
VQHNEGNTLAFCTFAQQWELQVLAPLLGIRSDLPLSQLETNNCNPLTGMSKRPDVEDPPEAHRRVLHNNQEQ